MSYSIFRVVKVKGNSATNGLQKHNQREGKNYTNPDIDLDKSNLNYDLINKNKINYNEQIKERLENGYNGQRKIRTDAIKHVDGIVTSDLEFFKNMDQSQTEKYFSDSLDFIKDEYGSDNILYATVHLDEKTPHMHFGFVPLTKDGRLSAKDILGNKTALSKLQDRFNTFVNEKGFNLERGESSLVTQAKNKTMTELKHDTKYHEKILEETKQKALLEKKNLEEVTALLKEQPKFKIKGKEKITEVKNKTFGKAEIVEKETENIILTPKQVELIQEQLKSALIVKKDYERLKNTDLVKENEELSHLNNVFSDCYLEESEKNIKLKDKNKELERENTFLKSKISDLEKTFKIIYTNTQKVFKDKFQQFKMILKGDCDKSNVGNTFEKLDNQIIREKCRSQEQKLER